MARGHPPATSPHPLRDAVQALERATAALEEAGGKDRSEPAAEQALALVLQARGLLAGLGREPLGGRLGLTVRVSLPCEERAAQRAREVCAASCAEWGLSPSLVSTAVDVVSELVANAARLGREDLVVVLDLGVAELAVRVWDDAPGTPRVLPYRPGVSERGVGLHLVRRLSVRWGSTQADGGKWVWAVLDRGDAPEAAAGTGRR